MFSDIMILIDQPKLSCYILSFTCKFISLCFGVIFFIKRNISMSLYRVVLFLTPVRSLHEVMYLIPIRQPHQAMYLPPIISKHKGMFAPLSISEFAHTSPYHGIRVIQNVAMKSTQHLPKLMPLQDDYTQKFLVHYKLVILICKTIGREYCKLQFKWPF